jgi:hypothetical protein
LCGPIFRRVSLPAYQESTKIFKKAENMKWILLILLVGALTGCKSADKGTAADEQWIQLFNGENLDGWDIKIAGYQMNDNFGKHLQGRRWLAEGQV